MNGVSRITAYTIYTRDDIHVTHAGPNKDNGKYSGWITLPQEDRFRPLLNTGPDYDTAEEAEAAMRKSMRDIREWAEKDTGGKHPIDHLLGEGPEAETVKKITAASRGAL